MGIDIEHVREMTRKAHAAGAYARLDGRERVAVFGRQVPLAAGSRLRIGGKDYEIKDDSYLVFVDLQHDANFAHPVLYELHSVADGRVTTIEERWPIADPEIEHSLVPHILPGKER
jgi:hypothetical protein